ncbi:O-acetylhomoserine aminocarboxypropyltransferase [Helicobacter sp. 16-1353]|uniref:O-acetylhomoserine aminocarboxypropyltransferase/cysteine synthase family protein n=1 Tax=Helicobacter sp. 16-1353 TaxID=2004996 RepID=UPI000DCC19E4|nr:aminotransferase class I/II-fold pyridoxal phosphate-dependent enzyme [Helicobacter sp. 16-1353]RAX51634.1 O-acetylhomoserine aminocarboxypropyltransferase [Helicobacter sp. 16-1353]
MKKETIAIQYGYTKDSSQSMAVPIYQTSAYEFTSSTQAAERFALKDIGNIYTRLTNSTNEILENRLAKLEGGVSGLVTSSGQAAIFYAITNLAQSGDNILFSNKIYGGSVTLISHTLKRFGIQGRKFELNNIQQMESLIDGKTKAIFFESLSNPQIAIADIEEIVKIAQKHGIITICDNTIPTPFLCNPISFGCDIVVHSTSKYIGGQGLSIGGVVIEREGLNEFFKTNQRYSHFNEPDSSYHGLIYSSLPLPCFNLRIRLALLRDIGACASPFNSWTIIQGLETLSLRIKEHSKNALLIAKFLENHKNVTKVNYPSLESNQYYNLSKKYLQNGLSSGLLSFEIKGSFDDAKKVQDSTKIFNVVVNIGDTKSIITHPASTTHSQLSSDELESSDVKENLIRLSVGIENVDDLIEDLENALKY